MARSSGFRSIVVGFSTLTLLAAVPVSASEPVTLEAGELDRVTAAGVAANASGRWLEVAGRQITPTLGDLDLTDRPRETAIALLIPAVQRANELVPRARQQLPFSFPLRLGTNGPVPNEFFYSHAYSTFLTNPS